MWDWTPAAVGRVVVAFGCLTAVCYGSLVLAVAMVAYALTLPRA